MKILKFFLMLLVVVVISFLIAWFAPRPTPNPQREQPRQPMLIIIDGTPMFF